MRMLFHFGNNIRILVIKHNKLALLAYLHYITNIFEVFMTSYAAGYQHKNKALSVLSIAGVALTLGIAGCSNSEETTTNADGTAATTEGQDIELLNVSYDVARDFYKGYKQLDKAAEEVIEKIIFTAPQNCQFNFEKVSKRTHLDIASVNTACQMQLNNDGVIESIHLSAGGVAPFPKYLKDTCSFLTGKKITADILKEAIEIINNEVAPISDARGTKEYKRLLLRQLFLAHFVKQENVIRGVLSV